MASRNDAAEVFGKLFTEHWPEFIGQDQGVKPYLQRRAEYFSDLDFFLLNDAERIVAAGWGVPLRWSGAVDDLPSGYTDALARSVLGHEAGERPDTFVVMGGMVRSDEQGRGWAGRLVAALRDHAVERGLGRVIAPVRPTAKARYPITTIEAYASWRRPDGEPFDPWLRTHLRIGGTMLSVAPRSQTMTGTVAEWEEWTGLALPGSGDYVIPDGLSTLRIDRGADTGVYHEPNIWVRHR
ncbi:hypothetical protein ACFFWC_25960 [Plantactinospora siamensis]|uniref:GNAT family N-acetyltransferase n=1 Tax=Plantactinospora siamensis TaxID=555372 RepID=A0ABV6P831_9ACTN